MCNIGYYKLNVMKFVKLFSSMYLAVSNTKSTVQLRPDQRPADKSEP